MCCVHLLCKAGDCCAGKPYKTGRLGLTNCRYSMHDVYYNQRIQKQASCPPWASIQLHGLFAHRSHKSHDTPSCRPWEDGVGTALSAGRLCLLSQSLPLACPTSQLLGPAGSAPGKCHRAHPAPTPPRTPGAGGEAPRSHRSTGS